MKRKLSLLLALLFVSASVASCGGGENAPAPGTDAPDAAGETAAEETVTTELTADLPDEDYEGKSISFVISDPNGRTWINPLIAPDAEDGEVLNDAIYSRNRRIEERFNSVIVQIPTGDERESIARNAILAGESDAFDVVMLTDRVALVFAQEGLLIPWDQLPYVDLSQPWWSQSLNSALSVANRMYFAYGDFNLIPYDYTHLLLYNKQEGEALGLDAPYDTVKGGGWDIETYASYAVAAVRDINGDGVMDVNDGWGLLSLPKQVLPCFWIASDVQSVSKDADDLPVFDLAADEKFATVIDRIFTVTYDNGTWMSNAAARNDDDTNESKFIAGEGLFLNSTFNNIKRLRGMDADFAVLPYPKWDESQASYRSRVEGGDLPMVTVLSTDLEFISCMLEAMSCESWKTVIPAYYEIALKGKNTRDADSEEMMDIIYNNRVYDLGDTYWCNVLRDGIFLQMFQNNNRDLASKIASVESKMANEIQKTVDAFAG